MRFKSQSPGGKLFAITGVNTVSFAVLATKKTKAGLLGFAVERVDPVADEQYFMTGFKVFASVIPHPDINTQVSTYDNPVQSFLWDDFTAKPDQDYEYRFYPVKGKPKKLKHDAAPLVINVRTEPLFSALPHDVFFNRGVASSQAYVRRYGTTPIAELKPPWKRDAALRWLSRHLGEAVVRFIEACAPGDRLLSCFYEFRYEPVALALKAAIDRGVDVRLIVDAKVNEHTDSDGFHPSFPRIDNLAMIDQAQIPAANVILREARSAHIQHNKFMVRVASGTSPVEVWTGSTNMSQGGISGQTNVGHWLRDPGIAAQFVRYWDLLATDPGGRDADTVSETKKKNKDFRAEVEALSTIAADLRYAPRGTTAVFSPRLSTTVLGSYAQLLDTAPKQGCITLAFGVNNTFKDLLKDNTAQSALVFMLLEKKDKPNPRSKTAFVVINASNNVYKAWGSFISDPVYQWARETNAGLLGLNQHVSYVHSKFLLIDPLSKDPIVITGSANFSPDSTNENDENMLVIRGDGRAADIYFTEFNRLFNHYYFRSVLEDLGNEGHTDGASLFLAENADWQQKYMPGTFRAKRLQVFAGLSPVPGP